MKGDQPQPFLADEQDLASLGISVSRDPETTVIRMMEEMRKSRKTLELYMETCTHCGSCIFQCHSYLGTQDPNNTPVGRGELMRKVYKRYFSWPGKAFPWLMGTQKVSPEVLQEWYRYYYQCNECRRCAVFCPLGIDTAEITIAVREMLTNLGQVPRFVAGVAKNLLSYGNNMGINPLALRDMVDFLEEELREETGQNIRIPLDETGAEVLYNPSSSDLFTNTDNLMAVAKVFHKAGISWTLSHKVIETANFGLFFHEPTMKAHAQRVFETARELKVKRVVAGECGHGWRTWRMFSKALVGERIMPIGHIIEEVDNLLKTGVIKLDPSRNPEAVTYHDPCNLARAAGIIEEPRRILRQAVLDFREMKPNKSKNFCCGAGSGLLMDETLEIRMKLGKVKAQQVAETRASILCAPCAICKAQLPLVMKHYGVEVTVVGLMDLVGKAIIL